LAWSSFDATHATRSSSYAAGTLADQVFPRNITFTIPTGTVTVDTIAVYCPCPWQYIGIPLKGKLQYTTDGTNWIDAGAGWDNTATVSIKNYDNYNDTLVDVHSNPGRYFQRSLGGQVAIKGARLVITTASQASYFDTTMSDPPGGAGAPPTSIVPYTAWITEFAAFNQAANVPHQPMRS
jgi:hypothetical protein